MSNYCVLIGIVSQSNKYLLIVYLFECNLYWNYSVKSMGEYFFGERELSRSENLLEFDEGGEFDSEETGDILLESISE